jgi:23S rRNA pseudouridine2604 synthase
MNTGVKIDSGITKPSKTKQISARKFSITLIQGLNRQIRKMCKALDYKVVELQRVRIMNIYLGDLAPGKFRKVTEVEQAKLLTQLSTSTNKPEATKKQYIPKKRPQKNTVKKH